MQFKDIVGQRVLINKLTEIIDSGRISHAQMFLGPNGYGSLALAISYAQYLNCQHPVHHTAIADGQWQTADGTPTDLRADACGTCPSCKKYQQLAHSDLHFIFPTTTTSSVKKDPASSEFQGEFRDFLQTNAQYASLDDWYTYMGVENKQGSINVRDAKDVVEILNLKAYENAYKVVIVWMVEKMRLDAANKLLKVLEEPTPNTLFLLVAEDSDKMLSTIISRTQLVKIGKIDDASLLKAFEGQPGTTESNFVAAAEGNLLSARHNINKTDLEQHFGDMFVTWMRQLFKLNMASLASWVDQISTLGREQQKQFLLYSVDSLRACFLKTSAGIELTHKLQFGDEKFNNSFSGFITENNIEKLTDDFNQALYAIERNAYSKIAFMELSFRISKALKKK